MKKTLLLLLFIFAIADIYAMTTIDKEPDGKDKEVKTTRKYQIIVSSLQKESVVRNNSSIDILKEQSNRGWKELGESILKSYKSVLTQKTVSATSGLIDLGVSFISEMVHKNSNDFNEWIKAKQEQCTYNKKLSTSESINDFYYTPSTSGALDPYNLKFNGFSCRNFIEVESPDSMKQNGKRAGHDAYYLSCKLRTDSLGMAHMANHSKFLLEVDTLIFYPEFCNIPKLERYDTTKYTNLELNINVNIYSSWINEAVMVMSDQKLGTFNIKAKIDPKVFKPIDGEYAFFYTKNDSQLANYVSTTGESFIVPRSFVGTSSEPLWGTGEYRIEMEVFETCQLKAEHYIKIEELGNVEAVNFANLPGYKKWEKEVWKSELKKMKSRKKGDSFLKNAFTVIKTAYLGHNWVNEIIEPALTPIYEHETKELKGLLNIDDEMNGKKAVAP